MAKKWVWQYFIKDISVELSLLEKHHITLPTECLLTAATEIQKRWDESYIMSYLNLEGECDE